MELVNKNMGRFKVRVLLSFRDLHPFFRYVNKTGIHPPPQHLGFEGLIFIMEHYPTARSLVPPGTAEPIHTHTHTDLTRSNELLNNST